MPETKLDVYKVAVERMITIAGLLLDSGRLSPEAVDRVRVQWMERWNEADEC